MKRLLDKLTNPFPIGVGAVTATAGILLGAPWLVGGAAVLWAGAAAMEYLQSKGKTEQKSTSLTWDKWLIQTKAMPDDVSTLIRDIIREGKGIDSMSKQVDIGAEIVCSDLLEVMDDVMTIGKQATLLQSHLQDWNLPLLKARLKSADGEVYTALSEQVKIIENLHLKYRSFYKELATLQAQMGAVRANLLQTSLQKEVPVDVRGELSQLRDTAHSIAESYALVTDDLPEQQAQNG